MNQINIIIFPIYIFLSLLSIMGYGIIFKKFINHNYNILNLKNIIFIQGLFLIGILSAVLNFFYPLTNNITLIILFLGIFFYIYFSDKEYLKKKNLSFIFFIVLFTSILSIYAGVSDDFNYHLETINNFKSKTLFEIEHNRRISYNSFWLFLNGVYTYDIFTSTYFVLASILYSITVYDSFYLYKKSIKAQNYNLGISALFVLIFLLGVLNKYKDFGTDIPGFLLLVYTFYIIFYKSFDRNENYSNSLLFIILIFSFSAFVFKITNTLIFLYLIIIINKIDYNKLNFFKLLIPLSIIFIWFFQNYNISGCLIWPQEITCFENNELAIKESYYIEAFAKGDINTNISVEGFGWVSVWFNNHFNKILEIYLIYLIILLIPIFYSYIKIKKDSLISLLGIKQKFSYLTLFILITVSNLIWFIFAPAYRFGIFYNLTFIIIILTPIWINLIKENIKSMKLYIRSILFLVLFYFLLENILKIFWYEKRYSVWPPILDGQIIERINF